MEFGKPLDFVRFIQRFGDCSHNNVGRLIYQCRAMRSPVFFDKVGYNRLENIDI